jgi:hypothetical protein
MTARTIVQQFARLRRGGATPYVGAVAIRTAARAIWGIALPATLSVAAYGRYQLIATAAAMAAQIALLGTPQTVVRFAGRRLPIQLIALHTIALAAGAIALATVVVPNLRMSGATTILAILVLATMAAALLGARAKASFAFTTSCVAEAAGAVVLILAALAASVSTTRSGGAMTPATALLIESTALMVTAAVLLRRPSSPVSHDEPATPTSRAVFANIYTVGALALLDVVLLRRLEVYFLQRSPDGLAGVAVLGLSLQIATVLLLVPTALLEAWQPRFAVVASSGAAALDQEVGRRRVQFARLMIGIVLVGSVVPLVAVPLVFPAYREWLGYIAAFVVIRLVCAGAGFYSSTLYAVGGQRALYAPALVTALVAVAANAALTRHLGLRGALIAYGLTQTTLAVLTVTAFRRTTVRRSAVHPAPATAAA